MRLPHRTMHVVCESAVDSTGAALGWLGVLGGDVVTIVAAAGADPGVARSLVGRQLPRDLGAVGYVLQSGQPTALQPAGKAGADQGVTELLGHSPQSLLTVPCTTTGESIGVLQVIDKLGSSGFSFDDIEVVTLLGTVAGAALVDVGAAVEEVPSPSTLARALGELSESDPERYRRVATVLDSLLNTP